MTVGMNVRVFVCVFVRVCWFMGLFILGKSREAERKRINKELANIRSKFKGKNYHHNHHKDLFINVHVTTSIY